MTRSARTGAILAGVAALGVIVVLVLIVSWNRDLTSLEAALFQIATLAISTAASFRFGRLTNQESSQKVLDASARSAIRRALNVHAAGSRYRAQIEVERDRLAGNVDTDGRVGLHAVDVSLDLLAAQLSEHASNTVDAIEDWRDVAPSAVSELESHAEEAQNG